MEQPLWKHYGGSPQKIKHRIINQQFPFWVIIY